MSLDEATEKIEQLVFDENKVVTYKLLSSELSVHVNKAKQLLNEYITDHFTKGKNDLNVYYAISGFQKCSGHKIHKLAVVPKDELEKIKEDFCALSSIHIYSIQKCSSLDECSLYTSDYLLVKSFDEPSVFSAIKHPNLKLRENRVVRNVESNSDNKKTIAESQAARKTEKSSVPAQKTNALFSAWQKKGEQKNKTVKEQNALPPAVLKNDDNTAPEKNSHSPQKTSKVADKASKNNIMSMFSKQAVKSATRTNTQNSERSVSQNSISSEAVKEEKQERRTEEKEEVKREGERARHAGSVSKNKRTSQKERQKQKRTHNISEDDSDDDWKKPKKKHKRIIAAFSDSESESEAEEKKDRAQRNLVDSESPIKVECNGIEEDDDDEIIPPTPDEEEPIPSVLLASATNGKRRKLKLVNKTFEDEDGFLVTRKVKEYVTDSEGSDNETAPNAKVAPKAAPAPKPDIKKNFVNKKQSSLMSFFKHK